jgi:multimeric flavodoxin WrbA
MHYNSEKLRGKVAGIFTSCGTKADGEVCLKMLEAALGLHHKMNVVGGIVRPAQQYDEEVERRCREYGKRLAAETEKG